MASYQDPFETALLDNEADPAAEGMARRPQQELPSIRATGAATARFYGFDLSDRSLVSDVPGLPGEIVPARSALALVSDQIGSPVVVVFEQGDLRRPIILGVLVDASARPSTTDASSLVVQVDETRLVLSAEREVVLRCGKASITLTRAGKILIQGEYVSTRAAGVNRIKGGSVQVN